MSKADLYNTAAMQQDLQYLARRRAQQVDGSPTARRLEEKIAALKERMSR